MQALYRISLVSFFVAISAALIPLFIWVGRVSGPEGLGGKAIFANLQGLELKYRNENLKTPEIFGTFPNTGPVVVVATFDKSNPHAWIAATIPSCDGQLCMVGGDANINIGCKDAATLESQMKLAPPVKIKFNTACHNP